MLRPFAVGLAGLLCALPACAEIITYEYSGVVSTLRQGPADDVAASRAVVSSNLFPGSIRVGDSFHGRISYDTSTPLYSSGADSAIYAWSYHQQASLLSGQTGQGWTVNGWSSLNVTNGTYGDAFTLSTSDPSNPLAWNSVSLLFSELTGKSWGSVDIPAWIDPAAFYQAEVYANWTEGGANLKLGGFITSMTRISPVPEPATWALLFAGLAIVAGGASRNRNRILPLKD